MKASTIAVILATMWTVMFAFDGRDRQLIVAAMMTCTFFICRSIEDKKP